jgi:hypothetical protein
MGRETLNQANGGLSVGRDIKSVLGRKGEEGGKSKADEGMA